MTAAAIWCRVSTTQQDTENQLIALRAWAERRGMPVATEFMVQESAWKGRQHPALRAAMEAGRMGEFDTMLVWSLDRLSREGPEAMLGTLRRFREFGVTIESLQEPWVSGPPEMQELLASIMGWIAGVESTRRSERVRAGLARRKAAGLPVGRLPGAKDLKPRKVSGYHARYGR
jgi:DNA invertase Pin-like site-specific DNA recombinase